MPTKKEVMEALKKVIDPEVGVSIVDLGLITGIEIKKDFVKVRMTLTSPLCPMGGFLFEEARNVVKKLKGVKKVEVEYDWEHPWTPERMKPELRKKFGL